MAQVLPFERHVKILLVLHTDGVVIFTGITKCLQLGRDKLHTYFNSWRIKINSTALQVVALKKDRININELRYHGETRGFHISTWYLQPTVEITKSNYPYLNNPTKQYLNTLRPRQNGRHFADDILNSIFLNENVRIPIKISLTFVPKGPIDNIPSLVQTMAWRRPGDKPLSEPMMVRLPAHICVTRPQWVNYMRN